MSYESRDHARARRKSLEKRLWNRLDWGLRALDVSAPNDLTGLELLNWAREKLKSLTENSEQDGDRIAAARALVSSAHAEIEHLERKRQFDQRDKPEVRHGSRPWADLSIAERLVALQEAKAQLATLEAQTTTDALERLPAPVEGKSKDDTSPK